MHFGGAGATGMGMTIRYGGIDFDANFLSGTDERGAAIRFTRAERLLLLKFTANAGVVLSRERLLDAVSGAESDAMDRNVDFVINRLRRKLGDAARNPSYIETRYGEGYLWIAERVKLRASSSGAFLVLGPVRGVQFVSVSPTRRVPSCTSFVPFSTARSRATAVSLSMRIVRRRATMSVTSRNLRWS